MKSKRKIKDDRWKEILAWVLEQHPVDHERPGPEPYVINDWAGGCASWGPRTEAEQCEARLLKRILSADRAETIESALAGVALGQVFRLTEKQVIEAIEYAAFDALPSNEKAAMAELPSLQVCLYARTYAIMQGDAERNTHATRGRKQLKHLHDINRGGTPRYTDEEIIAAFKAYKKRCGKMSLSSAIANIIDPARGGAEHLDYANATALWKKRLPAIAAPARPSQWWKDL